MPVYADVFDPMQKLPFFGVMSDDGHYYHSPQDMNAMNAGGGKIEGPKHACGDRDGGVISEHVLRVIPFRENLRGVINSLTEIQKC